MRRWRRDDRSLEATARRRWHGRDVGDKLSVDGDSGDRVGRVSEPRQCLKNVDDIEPSGKHPSLYLRDPLKKQSEAFIFCVYYKPFEFAQRRLRIV